MTLASNSMTLCRLLQWLVGCCAGIRRVSLSCSKLADWAEPLQSWCVRRAIPSRSIQSRHKTVICCQSIASLQGGRLTARSGRLGECSATCSVAWDQLLVCFVSAMHYRKSVLLKQSNVSLQKACSTSATCAARLQCKLGEQWGACQPCIHPGRCRL